MEDITRSYKMYGDVVLAPKHDLYGELSIRPWGPWGTCGGPPDEPSCRKPRPNRTPARGRKSKKIFTRAPYILYEAEQAILFSSAYVWNILYGEIGERRNTLEKIDEFCSALSR